MNKKILTEQSFDVKLSPQTDIEMFRQLVSFMLQPENSEGLFKVPETQSERELKQYLDDFLMSVTTVNAIMLFEAKLNAIKEMGFAEAVKAGFIRDAESEVQDYSEYFAFEKFVPKEPWELELNKALLLKWEGFSSFVSEFLHTINNSIGVEPIPSTVPHLSLDDYLKKLSKLKATTIRLIQSELENKLEIVEQNKPDIIQHLMLNFDCSEEEAISLLQSDSCPFNHLIHSAKTLRGNLIHIIPFIKDAQVAIHLDEMDLDEIRFDEMNLENTNWFFSMQTNNSIN